MRPPTRTSCTGTRISEMPSTRPSFLRNRPITISAPTFLWLIGLSVMNMRPLLTVELPPPPPMNDPTLCTASSLSAISRTLLIALGFCATQSISCCLALRTVIATIYMYGKVPKGFFPQTGYRASSWIDRGFAGHFIPCNGAIAKPLRQSCLVMMQCRVSDRSSVAEAAARLSTMAACSSRSNR